MLEHAKALLEEYGMAPPGCTVLCAVSGGADSMCLLRWLSEESKTGSFTVKAAHYDHRLRPASASDAGFVQMFCLLNGIECVIGGGDVRARSEETGRGIEETAREMRYAFLQEAAATCHADVIATAHTADDNAETLIFNLIRGCGLQGLTGIPPRRGSIVRPLLTTTRAEVEEFLAARGVDHVEDESNRDLAYTRNRIRLQVMPLLREINPKAGEHISAAITRLRQDNDVLRAQASPALSRARETEDGLVIPACALSELPAPLAVRCARGLLEKLGRSDGCSSRHLEAIIELSRSEDPSAMINLPGVLAQRVYGDLLLSRSSDSPPEPLSPLPLVPDTETYWGTWRIACAGGVCPEGAGYAPNDFWLNGNALQGSLTVRARQEGDALQFPGRDTKKLKKLLIDEKVPRLARDALPVLADEAGAVALGFFGCGERFLASPGSQALHITMQENDGNEEIEP